LKSTGGVSDVDNTGSPVEASSKVLVDWMRNHTYSENKLDTLVYKSFSKKYSIFTSTEVMVLESRLAFKGRKNNFLSVTTKGR
jgi:uncharacterized membrane protein